MNLWVKLKGTNLGPFAIDMSFMSLSILAMACVFLGVVVVAVLPGVVRGAGEAPFLPFLRLLPQRQPVPTLLLRPCLLRLC